MPKLEDLSGKTFNKLTVLSRAKNRNKKTYWECLCRCGKIVDVDANHLKTGHTKSCGCARSEAMKKKRVPHSREYVRLYHIWSGIKQRCYNPKSPRYYRYGGRGICMDCAWRRSFARFYEWALSAGYRNELTIDRIDNDKGYEADNCRWVDYTVQNNNRRDNVRVALYGEEKTVSEWCRELGLNYGTVVSRMKRHGMSGREALTLEKQPSGKASWYLINGERKTKSEWMRIFEISPSTVYYRVQKLGLPFEEAVQKPPQSRKKQNKEKK